MPWRLSSPQKTAAAMTSDTTALNHLMGASWYYPSGDLYHARAGLGNVNNLHLRGAKN